MIEFGDVLQLVGLVTLIFMAGVIFYLIFESVRSGISHLYYKIKHTCDNCEWKGDTICKEPCAWCKRYKRSSDHWYRKGGK